MRVRMYKHKGILADFVIDKLHCFFHIFLKMCLHASREILFGLRQVWLLVKE